ncbi:molybdenum cofactor guanylyltransferase [Sphingopyxis lindanitolerans]|uniref:molybdenum cofactor guanylyltransferase n=1 Tax=Sphingopyxis lindanitolerans TaxID=2054227 RepID=UPI001304D75E|nr:NTP transferase domain-containing protein [Sphingopyxis lindanitolerans]
MTPAPSIAGVVLAGGASSRFGRDKAEEMYRGCKLIDWSIAALTPCCAAIYVAGRAHDACASVPDRPRAGLGPLGGLAGALTAARERGFTRLLSLPCDTPHLPEGLLERLCRSDGAAFVRACPVIGIWPSADADRLADWLEKDGPRAMRAWADAIGAQAVETDSPIININRTTDFARLAQN